MADDQTENIIPDHVPAELVRENIFTPESFNPDDPFASRVDDLKNGPPIFYTPQMAIPVEPGKGTWVVTRADDLRWVFQQGDAFTIGDSMTGFFTPEPLQALPIEASGDDHRKYRSILNGFFKPGKVQEWQSDIRELCIQLINRVKPNGECDFTKDFSQKFPVLIFLRLMGMPEDKVDDFLEWEYLYMHSNSMEDRVTAGHNIYNYLAELITERRAGTLGDDIVSGLIRSEVDGRPLTDKEIIGYGFNLFLGGLDTVTTTSEWVFKYLAQHPQLQKKLANDNSLISETLEELLRMFPVIGSQRKALQDLEISGITIKKGDWVALPITAANYDTSEFDDPKHANFERQPNRHITFGAGPHRCAGSHLARAELRIAMEEWVNRLPGFRVKEGAELKAHPGAPGLYSLPLVWDVT